MGQSRQKLRASSSILCVHNAMNAYPITSRCETSWQHHASRFFQIGKKNHYKVSFKPLGVDLYGHDNQFLPASSDALDFMQTDSALSEDKYPRIVCWAIWIGMSALGWSLLATALRVLF